VAVQVEATEPVTFCGLRHYRFDLAGFRKLPSDWGNRWTRLGPLMSRPNLGRVVISLRLTPQELHDLDQLARQRQQTRSGALRQLLAEASAPTRDAPPPVERRGDSW